MLLCSPSTCLVRYIFETIGKAHFQLARTTSPGVRSAIHQEYPEVGLRSFQTAREEIGLEINNPAKFTSFLFGLGDREKRGPLTESLQAVLLHHFVYHGFLESPWS